MPRTEVVTSIQSQDRHQHIATAITRAFVAEGVAVDHVSVEFRPVLPHLVYSGERSLDQVIGREDFAQLRVYTTTRRGAGFRDPFVDTVVRAFAELGLRRSQVAIDFVPRESEDVYIGTMAMGHAPMPAVAAPPSRTVDDVPDRLVYSGPQAAPDSAAATVPATDVEEAVRDLLGRFWGAHVHTAAVDTLLVALVPDSTIWDSQAKYEIATNLEVRLGLPTYTLDIGTERVRAMFDTAVTLAGLVAGLALLMETAA